MTASVLELGPRVSVTNVRLIRGGSWWSRLIAETSETDSTPMPFPIGAGVEMTFAGITWKAVVDGAEAIWDISEEQVAQAVAAVESKPRGVEVAVWYLDPEGRRIPWSLGLVSVRG